MSGILKMEFRRLYKSPFFYVYPAIISLLLLFQYIFRHEAQDPTAVTYILEIAWKTFFVAIICAGIFSVHLWATEDKHGYTKNIIGNVSGRHILTITKLIISSLVAIFYMLVTFLYSLIMCSIEYTEIKSTLNVYYFPESADLMPEGFRDRWMSPEAFEQQNREFLNHHIQQFLLMMLVGIVIMAIIVFLYELTRSHVFTYVMTILIPVEFVENLLLNITGLITDNPILAKNLLYRQFIFFDEFTLDGEIWNEGLPVWQFWVRNILYFIIFAGASIYVSKKKDSV